MKTTNRIDALYLKHYTKYEFCTIDTANFWLYKKLGNNFNCTGCSEIVAHYSTILCLINREFKIQIMVRICGFEPNEFMLNKEFCSDRILCDLGLVLNNLWFRNKECHSQRTFRSFYLINFINCLNILLNFNK